MSKPYSTCPYCGAHLDPGERCDCQGSQHTEKDQGAAQEAVECGLVWNVSKQAEIPWYGYKCPRCRNKWKRIRKEQSHDQRGNL